MSDYWLILQLLSSWQSMGIGAGSSKLLWLGLSNDLSLFWSYLGIYQKSPHESIIWEIPRDLGVCVRNPDQRPNIERKMFLTQLSLRKLVLGSLSQELGAEIKYIFLHRVFYSFCLLCIKLLEIFVFWFLCEHKFSGINTENCNCWIVWLFLPLLMVYSSESLKFQSLG